MTLAVQPRLRTLISSFARLMDGTRGSNGKEQPSIIVKVAMHADFSVFDGV